MTRYTDVPASTLAVEFEGEMPWPCACEAPPAREADKKLPEGGQHGEALGGASLRHLAARIAYKADAFSDGARRTRAALHEMRADLAQLEDAYLDSLEAAR